VAALKARAEPLAQRVRQGDAAAETPLMPIVTASFTYIGIAYKQGIRSAQAEAMLKEAEKAQARWPAVDLAKVQDACQAEGLHLYAQSNFFERQIVVRAARSRIDKLRRPH